MTFRTRRIALLATLSLALAGGLALAQTTQTGTNETAPSAPPPIQAFHGDGGWGPGGKHDPDGRGHGPRGPEFLRAIFTEADADGDGTLTAVEIETYRGAQFGAADANGDGKVSLDEFATVYFARIRPQMVDAFQSFDDDGDGAITSAELEARVADVIDRLDRDGDGALSPTDRPRGHP
ncbi:MAG: EF-hand domain-containing protein [Amaricoccus sp.]|uniref:EF-hand domain-containing protein n=1 Tax=Amaricoccus sp. TaxID=1872485 RepID=UPI0033163B3B